MADDRTLAFEKRAYKNYRDEMDDISTIAGQLGERETGEIEEYREPLSCDERRELTILLSCGGPADGYKIYFDKDNQAIRGCYFFADWFEYEEFKLTGDELDRVISVYPVSPGLQYRSLSTNRSQVSACGREQASSLPDQGYLSMCTRAGQEKSIDTVT